MRNVVNIVGFQAGWFSSVLGAAHGMPWLGVVVVPVVLAVHLVLSLNKKAEFLLALAAAGVGFIFDTLLVSLGVFSPVFYALAAPFSPPWMVMLWVNFAITVNVSLRRLQARYFLCALLGAVGGPAAYYSGAQLGALTQIPDLLSLLFLASAWSVAVPVLFWLAARINRKFAP